MSIFFWDEVVCILGGPLLSSLLIISFPADLKPNLLVLVFFCGDCFTPSTEASLIIGRGPRSKPPVVFFLMLVSGRPAVAYRDYITS